MPVPRSREILAGVLVALSALVVAEAISRRVVPLSEVVRDGGPPGLAPLFAGSPELGWRLRPGFDGVWEDGIHRAYDAAGINRVDSEQVLNARLPKVLVLGGSDVFGSFVPPDRTLVEVLDRRLSDLAAIDLGVPGYSSRQGLIVAKEAIPRFRPRAVVLSFGFNDRRDSQHQKPDGPEQFADVYRLSAEYPLNRLRNVLEESRLFSFVETKLRRARGAAPSGPRGPFPLAKVRPRVDPASYEANLQEMARICRENGAVPVFLILGDDPAESGPLHAAEALVEDFRLHDGIEALRRLVAGNPGDTLARLELVKAYRLAGRRDEAEAILRTVIVFPAPPYHGMDPVVSDTVYERAMRWVARRADAGLVEGPEFLGRETGVFLDETHLTEKGHAIIGEALATEILRTLARQGLHSPGL